MKPTNMKAKALIIFLYVIWDHDSSANRICRKCAPWGKKPGPVDSACFNHIVPSYCLLPSPVLLCLPCPALRCPALPCTALQSPVTLPCTALPCPPLYCPALHSPALPFLRQGTARLFLRQCTARPQDATARGAAASDDRSCNRMPAGGRPRAQACRRRRS